MSEQLETNALLAQLKKTLNQASTLMAQLEATKRDDLPPETQTAAEEVGNLLPGLMKKATEARKTLTSMSPPVAKNSSKKGGKAATGGGGKAGTGTGKGSTGTGKGRSGSAASGSGSTTRSSRAETETDGGPSKRARMDPGPAKDIDKGPILIGHDKFLEELATSAIKDAMSESDFLPVLFSQTHDERVVKATRGLSLVVNGLKSYGEGGVIPYIATNNGDGIIQAIKDSLARSSIKDMDGAAMHLIYHSIDSAKGLYSRQSNVQYLQICGAGMQGLKFSVFWKSLEDDPHPKTRKGQEVLNAYLEQTGTEVDVNDKKAVEALKAAPDFIRYLSGFNNFKRGAIRYLEAYKVLGSVLLVCPLLDFMSFKDPVMGAKLNGLLPSIRKLLQKDPKRRREREGVHRELVEDIFDNLPAGKELLNALTDIEDSGLAVLESEADDGNEE
ncbi:hypothetical protein FRC11_012788 [Ceratobasidium sp. 423]|nr:hypothetical protein FRC11_012788 [Ceratobasidium sp. 423]